MLEGTKSRTRNQVIETLCENYKKYNHIDASLFGKYRVKRGLRNEDGTGVMAGLTQICNVHGYIVNEGVKEAVDGGLIYRGYDIIDIIEDCYKTKRFGYEEVAYLLLFGVLPQEEEIKFFSSTLAAMRGLPSGFVEDVILKTPSKNIMNKMAQCLLSLYTYDDAAESTSIEHELKTAIEIIARMPAIMVAAYQSKRKNFDNQSLFLHPIRKEETAAQSILSTLRADRQYTEEEALLLDLLMILQAEHGGGNNSTFSTRVLTSSGTDAYSAYTAGMGSLKGPKHGGANIKVMEMLSYMERGISNFDDEAEIKEFLQKILAKKEGDGSGLIYGMGHAVYTKSDPRAIILREKAMNLAAGTEFEKSFKLLSKVEYLAPIVLTEAKGDGKSICANVDLYSGLVFKMLQIPEDLFTPMFAVSRIVGWAAHRLEEIISGGRIMRPAYKSVYDDLEYTPLSER